MLKSLIPIVKSARTTAQSTCSAAPSANTSVPPAPTAAVCPATGKNYSRLGFLYFKNIYFI
jgi:hypothetical protein